jgi:DNA-binding NtrC family response regulator
VWHPLSVNKAFHIPHDLAFVLGVNMSPCLQASQGDKDEKLALSQVGHNWTYGKTPSSNREAATYWMANYPLVGRETEMNELRSYTAKASFNNSRVISVWGIAGIGKSALVRNLYYDFMRRGGEQFKKYSWVDVSHPFNLRDFSRSLISDHHSEKDPIKECREFLSQPQCLVVIDDLQSKEEWDLIQGALVPRRSSSIIIVITTEASLATYCTKNEDQVFNVKGLEADAAMDLFREEV